MAVFRVERNKGYTVMSNHHLRNKELSLKAKGLLSQMLSLPEDWDYGLNALSNNMILCDRKQLKNPNGLILGTPGSGKSFAAKREMTNVVLGLVIAVAGGTLIEKLHLESYVEDFIRGGNSLDVPQEELHFKDRIKYAWEQVLATAKKVAPYVLIGVGIGAFIHDWIPEDFIVKVLGTGNPFGVILATIAGVPMYADIFGTLPIAEALLAKGAQLGVVLSFMMSVTTLSLPSMIMLRKAVKPKLLGVFIAICTIGIILVGYFFNAISYLLI